MFMQLSNFINIFMLMQALLKLLHEREQQQHRQISTLANYFVCVCALALKQLQKKKLREN